MRMATNDYILTQEYLKDILNYNPDTGDFTVLKSYHPKKIGRVVGSLTSLGYIRITIKKKEYLAHRLAFLYMTGSFPRFETDHINRIKTDNRWANLRDVSHFENQINRVNNNKYIGVGWHKKYNNWMAYSKSNNGKTKYLGNFKTHLAACYARHAFDIKT
jgi:hypothetical protein